MKSKKIVSLCLTFAFILNSFAYADDRIPIDFGDDGSVITSGEDRYEGHEDGNCIGAGCDDRGNGGGYNRGDYDDDSRDDDFERHSFNEGRTHYERDERGARYARGSKAIQNAQQHVNPGNDNSDIFYDNHGTEYVKSTDGKKMLPLRGLLSCSETLSCFQQGYKADWWNYSTVPGENATEAGDYMERSDFAKKYQEVDRSLDRLKNSSQQSHQKAALARVSTALQKDAKNAYLDKEYDAADDLLEGARALATFALELGVSISPAGWAKDVYEFTSGRSFVTQTPLSDGERLMAGLGMVAPALGPLGFAGIKILKSTKAGLPGRILNAIVSARSPQKTGKFVRNLPPIRKDYGDAFEGHIFPGVYYAGEVVHQVQRAGATTPGRWFTPIRPRDAKEADEMLNIFKYHNYADQIKTYVFKENVSGYAGKVAGGSGHQFYIPDDVPLNEVLDEVSL
ncbi:pre-toxin TG domain-containing protein [Bdellovibrio bacteriovorus]|uniref:pre-toxin TG domain-containing protein n=1 Tax=Bdellovibrio bacteriovorus TaxID=959 RepID=UPI003AA7C3F3